jgi:hypothetical protein
MSNDFVSHRVAPHRVTHIGLILTVVKVPRYIAKENTIQCQKFANTIQKRSTNIVRPPL